ncbi:MAG TPA: DUF4097 family beta strand repeat-containing protein [Solirubrobacteraceae bacterium]|jgi:hypothetical protein|nr:DUF4097 family beta strand repeat-containing protein [Solirubrobacteraceae bacterium]
MATTQQLTMPVSSMPSPVRRLLLVLGSTLVVALILFGGFTLLDIAAHHTYDVRSSYAAVQSLEIDDGSGRVALTGSTAGGRVTLTQHVSQGLTSPRRAATLGPGGVLRLTSGCSGFDLECRVGYAVTVPVGIPVTVNSGAGDVSASDLHTAGVVHLSSGAGDISATDISGQTIQLSSDAGDVVARRIGAPQLRLSSGAGDITADVTSPVGKLVAGSGAGDVT